MSSLVDKTREYMNIECLSLDRGFFNVESIESLVSGDFVITAIRNEKIKKMRKPGPQESFYKSFFFSKKGCGCLDT
jgi:hypothetical protein